MPLGAGNPAGVVALGYALSSEELGPQELVDNAVAAERAGFSYALVSDHFHPWLDVQGESPFVWSTIGATLTGDALARGGHRASRAR